MRSLVSSSMLALSSGNQYFPNSPSDDPNGYAASITKNPLRTIFENVNNADEGNYMAGNHTWVIHDPSNIVEIDGILTMFVTGKAQEDGYRCAAESWYMFPGETGWRPGNCIWSTNQQRPPWWREELGSKNIAIWAPGVLTSDKMLYSLTNGPTQCVGAVQITGTAPNLDWEDLGEALTCAFDPEDATDDVPSAIDPAGFIDSNGKNYVLYGGGHVAIFEVSLEEFSHEWWPTGHSVIANGPKHISDVAQNIDPQMEPGNDGYYWAEAPFMHKHGAFYYLFYNWYGCCSMNPSYEIRVCRSTTPTAGFVDDQGRSCLEGNAKLFKDRTGPGSTSNGPGHPAIFSYKDASDTEHYVFSNHYYRPDTFSGLGFVSFVEHHVLIWQNGWPELAGPRWNPMNYWNRDQITGTTPTGTTPTGTTPTETTPTGTTPTETTPGVNCVDMKWKGKKASKMMYRGKQNGKRSYIIRQTILNNSDFHPNIRAGPYTGFFMFSRRYCGTDFFDALSDGTISLGMYDYESTYEIKFKHTRIDGSKGSSVTVQYYQTKVGEADAPWTNRNGNNVKKDQFFLTLDNVPDSFDDSKEADCFNLLTGVLPTGESDETNWTQCASTQKDAGF